MELIDVTEWKQDDAAGIFPVGARDKLMIWSPSHSESPLKANYPYLFKESIKSYPDQFWTEIIASIVGDKLGVVVPKAFPAVRNIDGEIRSGALIEWMYQPNEERLVHAGDFFKVLNPEFDSELGSQHNLKDMMIVLRTVNKGIESKNDIHYWLADMALFDALIGNTDRHQENWGFIFKFSTKTKKMTVRMSPLYDNGTSLGHERFTHKVADWDSNRLTKYLLKGLHHLRYVRTDTSKRIPLFSLAVSVSSSKQLEQGYLESKLRALDMDGLLSSIKVLTQIEAPIPLSEERIAWICRILQNRHDILVEVLTSQK